MKKQYNNTYLSTGLCIWLQLEEYAYGEDLLISEIGDDTIGIRPDALAYETNESNWDLILDITYTHDTSGLGWSFVTTWTDWALREGIAPYQAFCVRIDGPPIINVDDSGECDVNFAPWRIVEKEKLSLFETRRRWDHWFMMRARFREQARNAMRYLLHQQQHDLSAMYLHSFSYNTNNSCDEMLLPNGYGICLCSRHTAVRGFNKIAWANMVEGRSDRGDQKAAMAQLLEHAAQRLPHLAPEFIRGLPRRW